MKIVVLREAELRKCVSVDLETIVAVENGFTHLARGEAVVPPIVGIDIPENNGDLDIKTAYIRGLDSFAIKIAAGFYDNGKLGLPTSSGMMVLVSAKTGFPEAALFDNSYLTQVRTGAAGAIAAKYLAKETVETVGVIGAGTQARYQMMGLKQVRNFSRLLIYGLIPEEVDQYIAEMTPLLGVEIIKADNAESVVRESEIVVTTTPSRQPYLKAEWVHPGLHITAMGADGDEKQELFAGVFGRADLIACDRKAQCLVRGELHHALEAHIISQDDDIIELGELTSGSRSGRSTPQQVTVCDLTGVGVQDTAIALLAFQKAEKLGLGMQIEV